MLRHGFTVLLASATVVLAAAETSVFSKASNDSLLWGPYRSNLYFGIKPRLPRSLSTGLLWARVEDFTVIQDQIRITCEQHEGMAGYGWDAYDPRIGGVQVVHDKGHGLDLETSFVKFDEGTGGWAARIKGTIRDDAEPGAGSQGGTHQLKTAVWFSVTLDGIGSIAPKNAAEHAEFGYEGEVEFNGNSADLGDFKLRITEPESNSHPVASHEAYQSKPLDRTLVNSFQIAEENIWQTKGMLYSSLRTTIDEYMEEYGNDKLPPPWQTFTIPNKPGNGNGHLVQKVFEGPFEFDVFFTPASREAVTSEELTKALKSSLQSFDKKYSSTFQPQSPFTDKKYDGFGKSLFSNLIGGIGYFHGDQAIDRSGAPEYEEDDENFWEAAAEARSRESPVAEGPYELFTAVPSRPFFPRGFLWDEGFHLLPILEWDAEVAMQIISSWYNTMDEDGWIAREQIVGAEARSKVPVEFQVQYPHYANPPTLFMAIEALLNKFDGSAKTKNTEKFADSDAVKTWLSNLYPLLQRNFDWYRRTQAGDIKTYEREAFSSKEGYRWRGRTPRHTLTSGLDDYPRAQPPHIGELHVDLLSWIGLMARNIQRIATFLGEKADATKYSKIVEAISRNVDDLHWSKEHKAYCDVTADEYDESTHVCHKGYISLFPFMTGLLGPEHPHLKDVLDLIGNENELWSPFGIRSLSARDEGYGQDENYWRSPIWINMNYLIVNELLNIAQQPGPQKERATTLYSGLRQNLVENVYNSWLETGFAWEQYNPDTGAGQRTQHFTGWTSLVVQLMAMPDLKGAARIHEEL